MHWSESGESTGKGRGGSRKGRSYRRVDCPHCGHKFGSNVLARHVRKCPHAGNAPPVAGR